MHTIINLLKTFALAMLCVLALACTINPSQAQTPTRINIDFQPHQSGYPRGTRVKLVAHLQGGWGWSVSGMNVSFYVWVQSTGILKKVGVAMTDASGNATYVYTVPGVGNNNVYVLSQFDGWYPQYWWGYWGACSDWKRLPIG